MRRFIFFWVLLFAFVPLFAEMSIQNIEKMVQDIRAKRTSKITNTTPVVSPFIVIQQDENRSVISNISEKMIKTNFLLGAIVNSTAFIDGSWKKKGEMVGDFQLDTVGDNHVVLKRKNRTITLYFRKTKNILTVTKE
jgi:hypothetical protein